MEVDTEIPEDKVVHFRASIYLLKHFEKIADYVKEEKENLKFQKNEQFEVSFFVRTKQDQKVDWHENIETLEKQLRDLGATSLVEGELPSLEVKSFSALVIWKCLNINDDKGKPLVFAITFGHGRHILNTRAIVKNFGFRFATNKLSAESICEIVTSMLRRIPMTTTRQTLEKTDIIYFGLDPFNELATRIGGFVDGEAGSPPSTIHGADHLNIALELNVEKIQVRLGEIYATYKKDDYKEVFPWLDYISEVADSDKIKDLDIRFLNYLLTNKDATVQLNFKKNIDFDEFSDDIRIVSTTYGIDCHHTQIGTEIRSKIESDTIDVSEPSEFFKRFSVKLKNVNASGRHTNLSFRDNICSNIIDANYAFYTIDGRWFKFHADFIKEIEERYRFLFEKKNDAVEIKAFEHISDEVEAQYNEAFTKFLKKEGVNALNLDADEVTLAGRSSIEVCDLLTESKHFIHVKRYTGSSTLSHLFKQGENSAYLFSQHKAYVEAIKSKNPVQAKLNWLEGVDPASPFERDQYTVLFIVLKNGLKGDLDIPIFSKISMIKTIEELIRSGFKWDFKIFDTVSRDEAKARTSFEFQNRFNAIDEKRKKDAEKKAEKKKGS